MKRTAHGICAALSVFAAGCFVDHSDLAPWNHDLSVPVELSDLANSISMDLSKQDGPAQAKRRCTDFPGIAGVELACWDFSNAMFLSVALQKLDQQCWTGANRVDMGVQVLQGKNESLAPCTLDLTNLPDIMGRRFTEFAFSEYSSMMISVKYWVDGSSFAQGSLILRAGNQNVNLNRAEGEQLGVIDIPIPMKPTPSPSLSVVFTGGQTDQALRIKSVIATGIHQ